MQFKSVQIAKYGKFENANVGEFAPFTIVHGRNEAGKSTVRRMLRDFLFGFPKSRSGHPYGFNGTLEATAIVQTTDIPQLRVHRKRSSSEFVEFSGGKCTRDAWKALLGGLNEDMYASLLCCSGMEMNNTAQALQNGEFLQTVQSDMAGGLRDDKALVLALGEKVKTFAIGKHRKFNELKALTQEVDTVRLGWNDMSSLTQQLEKLLRAHQEAGRALQGKQAQRLHLEKLVELSGLFEEQERLTHELWQSGAPQDFPHRAREQWNTLSAKRESQLKKLAQCENEMQELMAELAQVPAPESSLLEAGSILLPLQGSSKSVETMLCTLPSNRKERDAIAKELEELLSEHLPNVTLDAWLQTGITETARKELELIWASVTTAQSTMSQALESLKSNRATLSNLSAPGMVLAQDRHLAAIWDNESAHILKAIAAENKAEFNHEASLRAFGKHRAYVELAGFPDMASLMAMKLPQGSDVTRLAQQWIVARDTLDENCQDLQTAERELNALSAGCEDTPATPELREQWRTRRDRCWVAIQARHIEGAPDLETESLLELESDQDLVTEFDEAIAQADTVADRLLERDETEARIAELQTTIAALTEAQPGQEEALSEALEAWEALWKAANFVPGKTPESGLLWFERRMAANDDWNALVATKQQLDAAQSQLTEFASRVADILGVAQLAHDNAADKCKEAVARIKSQEENLARHQRENHRLTTLVAQEEVRLATAEQNLDLAKTAWQKAFAQAFGKQKLPADASAFLEALTSIIRDVKELRKLNETIASQEKDLNAVAVAIQSLLTAQGLPELGAAGLAPLLKLWSQAQENDTKRKELCVRLDGKKQVLRENQLQLANLEQEIVGLVTEAACTEEQEFLVRLDAWEAGSQRRSLLRSCTDRIDHFEQSLHREAKTQPRLLWQEQRDALVSELESMTQQRDVRSQEMGALKKELETKEMGNEAVLEARLALARKTTELHEQARAHLRNSLAKVVLEKARERYSESHVPQLQRWAGEYLSAMTNGLWTSIDLSNETSVKIYDANNRALVERSLSTGTADQVRLAIRMAVAQHWAMSHEPLPFILDDVLVHTDEERLPRALHALQELSKHTQVVYFTCHDSVKAWGMANNVSIVSIA